MNRPSAVTIDRHHPATRHAALARLADFVPLAGSVYAAERNADHGPGRHHNVSRLSAALRRRLVSETDVLRPILARHGHEADSFVSEVFWRTYFKGWLESRPMVWDMFRGALDRIDARLARDDNLAARHLAAIRGETGIDCFDHWMAELATTGYLHNWARMQVASIWIFTFELPWELGARHFLDHLVDADPASNTLSWRWVAGLHTRGKTYLADAARITRMTGGRFHPVGLATRPRIPDAPEPPRAVAPREVTMPIVDQPALVWISPEDCSLETEPALARLPVRAVAVLPQADAADHIATRDALARAAAHWGVPALECVDADDLARVARSTGCEQVITGRAAVGPAFDRLITLRAALRREGLALAEHVRVWDRNAWPHATRGFFALREKIPDLLAAAGLPR